MRGGRGLSRLERAVQQRNSLLSRPKRPAATVSGRYFLSTWPSRGASHHGSEENVCTVHWVMGGRCAGSTEEVGTNFCTLLTRLRRPSIAFIGGLFEVYLLATSRSKRGLLAFARAGPFSSRHVWRHELRFGSSPTLWVSRKILENYPAFKVAREIRRHPAVRLVVVENGWKVTLEEEPDRPSSAAAEA